MLYGWVAKRVLKTFMPLLEGVSSVGPEARPLRGHMRVELGGEDGAFSWRKMDDVLSCVSGLSCGPGLVVRLLSLGCLVMVSASCVTRAIQTVVFALSCCMLDIIVSCSVPI